MADEQWSWQEKGAPWYGIGIYHVTLVVPSRKPLLGSLVIPNNDPAQAKIERTELGEKLVNEIYTIGTIHKPVRILQFCLMPDHLHLILHLRQEYKTSIRAIIRGFWQGAKRLGREYTLSIDPELNSGTTNQVDIHTLFPVFTEQPFIRPLSRSGQLSSLFRYIRMNPQRLATKRLMPDYFRVQESIEIDGQTYRGVGNLSPWEYDSHKKHVSRAECVAMNKMAERICSLSIDPE